MDQRATVRARLRRQRLVGDGFATPADVVRAFGAVQAQDYRAALWGIGARVPGSTEADVERALANKEIVRTWPMRGTLHFVPPEDVRWMVALLAPRVIRGAASRYRQLGLDDAVFRKCRSVLGRKLRGKVLTRAEIFAELERAGIGAEGQRGVHVIGRLSMDGMLCSGPHRGKQPTHVLLDEWVPPARELDEDEALGEIAARYFGSHAPATVQDFAWWTGLPLGRARRAMEIAGPRLPAAEERAPGKWRPVAHILPCFDELTVAYRDRAAFLDPAYSVRTMHGIMAPVIVLDGRIAGIWSRDTRPKGVTVRLEAFVQVTGAVRERIEDAAAAYGRFLGAPTKIEWGPVRARARLV